MAPTRADDARFWRSVALFWLVAGIVMIATTSSMIVAWRFPDPDDQLRLLEVRDWLSGQSWFDVTQYRLNAPAGVPMHWSRLIDLPIAGVIMALRPLVGAHAAETVALVIVPLATLAATLAALAALARRLLPDEPALLAVCLSLLCVEVVHQLRPMRIDHHGWQMALAVTAAAALTRRGWRAGCVAGGACGVWLAISLEGLPMVAAILALAALRWVADPAERGQFRAATVSAAAVAAALFVATHRWSAWQAPACDALSSVYLAMLGVAAVASVAITALPIGRGLGRLVAMAGVGVLALLPLIVLAPGCAAGPFASLDPLVRTLWYDRVMEGLPIWKQPASAIAGIVAAPLLGIAGAAGAIAATRGDGRRRWTGQLFLLVAAMLSAMLVQRSAGVADLLATPGLVRLCFPLLVRARTIASVPRRIAATLACLLIATPALAATLAIGAMTARSPATRAAAAVRHAQTCTDGNDMRALAVLPRGMILAPLDIAPSILLLTDHSAVASGHHRGAAAMHDVIAAWTGSAADARAVIARHHVDYVAFCPGLAEILDDEGTSPQGLLAQLDRNRPPAWLTPIVIAGSPIRVWRVR